MPRVLAIVASAAMFLAPVAALALPPRVAPAASGGFVVADSSTYLLAANVVSGATAGYVMVLDAPTVPSDGAVVPALCLPLAANTGLSLNFRSEPMMLNNGATVVFSTSGCYTLTKSATAYISGEAR